MKAHLTFDLVKIKKQYLIKQSFLTLEQEVTLGEEYIECLQVAIASKIYFNTLAVLDKTLPVYELNQVITKRLENESLLHFANFAAEQNKDFSISKYLDECVYDYNNSLEETFCRNSNELRDMSRKVDMCIEMKQASMFSDVEHAPGYLRNFYNVKVNNSSIDKSILGHINDDKRGDGYLLYISDDKEGRKYLTTTRIVESWSVHSKYCVIPPLVLEAMCQHSYKTALSVVSFANFQTCECLKSFKTSGCEQDINRLLRAYVQCKMKTYGGPYKRILQ